MLIVPPSVTNVNTAHYTSCLGDDHWEDPRFATLNTTQRAAFWQIMLRVRRYKGSLTDDQLRSGLSIGKRHFGEMIDSMIGWNWLRRHDDGCLDFPTKEVEN